ncbi:MAG: hypothetical protein AAF583_00980 [Pseudomonadota bacterium]
MPHGTYVSKKRAEVEETTLRIALTNRFFPPDGAITGRSLEELARYLVKALPSADLKVFCSEAKYRSQNTSPHGAHIQVERLPFKGLPLPGKIGRLINGMLEGHELAKRASDWGDIVISMTDPPLLGYWMAREIERRGQKAPVWIEWTMDLYPEAFVAAGLASPKNPVLRSIKQKLRQVVPDAYICLGDAQAKYVAEQRGADAPTFIVPCGVLDRAEFWGGGVPAWRANENRIVFVYAGNIGEAHCPDFLPSIVRVSDPEKHLFVLALYGAHAERTRDLISEAVNVTHLDYISHNDAAHADVHIASLIPRWNHICVPSKAVSSISLGKPILYSGDNRSDNSMMLADAMWRIQPELFDREQNAAHLSSLMDEISNRQALVGKSAQAEKMADQLLETQHDTFAEIAAWTKGVQRHPSK